jgi:hypothetical protein
MRKFMKMRACIRGILIETSIAVTFRRDVRSMAATASSAEAASLVNHGRAWTI